MRRFAVVFLAALALVALAATALAGPTGSIIPPNINAATSQSLNP